MSIKVIKDREELKKWVEKLGDFVYCIATDSDNKVITPYLWIYDNALMEDVVSGVRIYHNKEVGEYFNLTKIGNYYADVDAHPVYKDWINFPISNVLLYTEETAELLTLYMMLGMWQHIVK